MNFPENLKYTEDHEWLLVEGNIGTMGITAHAAGELGDVVYIDIADDLESVAKGESFGTIEAVKTVADIYAPATGKVIEVNRGLNDAPETVNNDPYGEGWLIKFEIDNMEDIADLMDSATYQGTIGH
jgi:glycine cleavage system H protein